MSLQTVNDGQYGEFLNGAEVAVMEFGAAWCPPCKILLPLLSDLADSYGPAVAFGKVDVDEAPGLASQFGVMGMPTVIVFKNGVPADKLVGLRPREAYKNVIDRSLGV